MARILGPEAFGLIAMLWIFMSVSYILSGSGYPQALVQKPHLSELDRSSVFYLMVFFSFILGCIIYFCAPLIGYFYDNQEIIMIMKVMGFIPLIYSFGSTHTAILTRNLRFNIQAKANLGAVTAGGLVGIYMSYNGYGVWSLVALSIVEEISRSALLWLFHDWKPSFQFSLKNLVAMRKYSVNMLLFKLLTSIFENIYFLIIGRLFTPTALGYYYQANRLQRIPSTNLTQIVSVVVFPTFSNVQDDKKSLTESITTSMALLTLFIFPIMVGLSATSFSFVSVLLSDKWLPSVDYLRLLCLVGLIYPLQLININLLMAKAKTDQLFFIEIIKTALTIIALISTYRFGIESIILGQIIVSMISFCILSFISGRLSEFGTWEQIKTIFPIGFVSAIMGSLVYMLEIVLPFNGLSLLLMQVGLGITTYSIMCYLFKLKSFKILLSAVQPRLRLRQLKI
tara:strand:+ start:280 stop:1641 length:1362 start_codon:yes stop_codon:yes gene_type:complete